MQDDVFAAVQERAAVYRRLTDAYDQALLLAHDAGHGTRAALEHLRKATAIAPDVMDALRSYQAAVAVLASHLREQSSSERRGGEAPGIGAKARRLPGREADAG